MDLQREYFACLALRHTPRLGTKVWKELFAAYPSAYDAVCDAGRWHARELAAKGVAKACASEVWREKAEAEFREARRQHMEPVTFFDPRYPQSFRELPDPPALFYMRGDQSLLANPGVAVVGARECTRLGLETAGRISAQLSKTGITVISGLALGIDRQAHLGGLKGVGSSIAVLGCGLDVGYPPGNADVRQELYERGLVITEYAPGMEPRPGNFPYRNRLISALSLGVLVAEAAHNSGSLITARLAGEQGRDVFAVPGPIGQPTFTGCHRLIKQGAALVESAADIIEILRFDFARELANVPDPAPEEEENGVDAAEAVVKKKKGVRRKDVPSPSERRAPARIADREGMNLTGDERRVLDLIDAADKVHIDALGREMGWDSSVTSRVLLMLEMRGAVQQLPGMWYIAREN